MSDLAIKLREIAAITMNKWNKKGATLENSYLNQAADLIEQQQQRIEELEQALTDDAIAKIMLEKMALENGQLDIQMSGNIFHIFCEAFVKTFKEAGAENYLTTEFHSSELGAFTVTMQRSKGMSVYEKLHKVEQERDELTATVERLLKVCELAYDNYGKMLITDPPQEAWKVNQVTEKLAEAIAATPQQNLNSVKREVYADGYYQGFCDAWFSIYDQEKDHIHYGLEQSKILAEKLYPSTK